MSQPSDSRAVETARAYYNSDDADTFYAEVWGGEDIHVGLYAGPDEPIAEASRRTVARMAELAAPLAPDTRVLDLGAGYGGAMRYLARAFGCSCVALNLAEVENERNRRMTHEAGLDAQVDVVSGDFTALAFEDATFDRAWSQEAFLHAGDRAAVCAEAARVLKPGGLLVFTDPMQVDDAPADRLGPVYDRLHLASLASPRFYRETLCALGMREVTFDEQPQQLVRHYARVRDVLAGSTEQLHNKGVSDGYIERMKAGLGHWVDGGREGLLTWGIFVFEKATP
ncbi:MAG: methyltransferase domain-containing protein [Pseudohaliea sp.]